MMGLRITEGIDRNRYQALAGAPMSQDALAHLQEIGMISIDPRRIRVTDQGRMVLNSVIKELLPG